MRDAAGEGADALQPLHAQHLLFEAVLLGFISADEEDVGSAGGRFANDAAVRFEGVDAAAFIGDAVLESMRGAGLNFFLKYFTDAIPIFGDDEPENIEAGEGVRIGEDRSVGRTDVQNFAFDIEHGNKIGDIFRNEAELLLTFAEFFFGVSAFQRHGDLRRDKGEDIFILRFEALLFGVRLDHHRTQSLPAAGFERYAEPACGIDADKLDFASPAKVGKDFRRCEEGFAGAKDVAGERFAGPHRREVGLLLIGVVGEGEHIGRGIVQRDVEVSRGHELADDEVDRAVQVFKLLDGLRRFGDAIDCFLEHRGAASFCDIAKNALVKDDVAVLIVDIAAMIFDEDRRAVFAAHAINFDLFLAGIENVTAAFFGSEVEFFLDVDAEHFLPGVITEHSGEGLVDVDELSIVRALVDAVLHTVEERAEAFLACAKILRRPSCDW